MSAARSARSAPRRAASPCAACRVAIARSTLGGVGPELAGQHREESHAAPIGERVVGVGDRGDVGPLGRGVVALEEMGDDRADRRRVPIVEIGPDIERDARAAPAGPAAEAIEEATGWHHATMVHPPCAMH